MGWYLGYIHKPLAKRFDAKGRGVLPYMLKNRSEKAH